MKVENKLEFNRRFRRGLLVKAAQKLGISPVTASKRLQRRNPEMLVLMAELETEARLVEKEAIQKAIDSLKISVLPDGYVD